MKISELEIGQFYTIKNNTRKKVILKSSNVWGLALQFIDIESEMDPVYKKSYYQYLGKRIVKLEKRIDSKRREVYTYRPHMMLCIKTGETCKVAGYYIRNFFIKPTK
tara:strand:- start:20 stop:340 length:321 start_codon:yes stop_codon:yes gene_type:complete